MLARDVCVKNTFVSPHQPCTARGGHHTRFVILPDHRLTPAWARCHLCSLSFFGGERLRISFTQLIDKSVVRSVKLRFREGVFPPFVITLKYGDTNVFCTHASSAKGWSDPSPVKIRAEIRSCLLLVWTKVQRYAPTAAMPFGDPAASQNSRRAWIF